MHVLLMTTGSWGIIIGVASIVIAILIYFLQKQIRYPGQLKISVIETWKVRRASPNGYGELSLKYNDYEIEEELNYVKIVVYNRKSYDYSSGSEDNPVRIILPEGCKWIDAKIVSHSKEVQAEIANKDGKELALTFNLLRKNEYIELDGLMEAKSDSKLGKLAELIEIKHRIPNVSSTKNAMVLNSFDYKHAKKVLTMSGLCLGFVLFGFFNVIVFRDAVPIKYKELESGEIRTVYVDKRGDIVTHKGVVLFSGYSAPMSKEEFAKKYEPCFDRSLLDKTDYVYLGTNLAIFLMLAFIIIGWSVVLMKSQEIKKIMKQ